MNKKENETNKRKKQEAKARKKEERKTNNTGGGDNMMAYVDEYGNLSETPPDPTKRTKIKAENIVIGVPKRTDEPAPDVNRTGVVTMFNESKGYGFIKDAETQQSYFTHVNNHEEEVRENDRVSFQLEQSPRGPTAVNVKKG